eukprot:CAMPEP_0184856950 /NCGR_PEP_ID=MMETSP0580-20130426/2116_1 /TAXON_ID=1118495 /ORGANISM="Dactyliosolen fragilissimus" /LENGTH=495 /DNA_ID=CAMNT_0027352259 /DNA_START=198 /DNA_END=1686 /DNA_ORIENTATION=-
MAIKRKSSLRKALSRDDAYKQEKIEIIKSCLEKEEVDLWELRELCLTKGGLINADQRRRAWHKLTGIDRTGLDKRNSFVNSFTLTDTQLLSENLEIIARDVGRAVYFRYTCNKNKNNSKMNVKISTQIAGFEMLLPVKNSPLSLCTSNKSEHSQLQNESRTLDKCDRQKSRSGITINSDNHSGDKFDEKQFLSTIILGAITPTGSIQCCEENSTTEDRLYYYQGFHDVASIMLYNLPQHPQQASAILHQIAKLQLRDALRKDFTYLTTLLELALLPLLEVFDKHFHDFMVSCEIEPTFFLNWLVTLFSHDVHDPKNASRLMDAILASHSLMSLYLVIAILLHPYSQDKMMNAGIQDSSEVYVVASSLLHDIREDFDEGDDDFTFQNLINSSLRLMKQIPPDSLQKFILDRSLELNPILLDKFKAIHLFNPPPSHALASKTLSDWNQRKFKRLVATKSLKNVWRASFSGKGNIINSSNGRKPDVYVNAMIAQAFLH